MKFDNNQSSWAIDESQYSHLKTNKDRLLFLLKYAVLAPSMHNTQPWKITLNSNEITISPDMSRMLKVGDYDQRGYFFSVGCMLENLRLAGQKFGWEFTPKNISREVIQITAKQKNEGDSKISLDGIVMRHTNRSPYKSEKLPKSFITQVSERKIEDTSATFLTGDVKNEMGHHMAEGTRIALKRKDFRKELSNWMRSANGNHDDGMPVHVFNFPKPLSYIVKHLIPHLEKAADQASKQDYKAITQDTPALILITTKGDSIVDWVNTGRLFQYASIIGAQQGIYFHPMYATVHNSELRAQVIKAFCKGDNVQLQFVSRVGFPTEVRSHTPRKNVEAFITTT